MCSKIGNTKSTCFSMVTGSTAWVKIKVPQIDDFFPEWPIIVIHKANESQFYVSHCIFSQAWRGDSFIIHYSFFSNISLFIKIHVLEWSVSLSVLEVFLKLPMNHQMPCRCLQSSVRHVWGILIFKISHETTKKTVLWVKIWNNEIFWDFSIGDAA